ncbi:hypothetical protein EV356DRAFT_574700 [Viridothelium virens]|uniref:Rhodopsin domain-containing protein n=1 Tax=Viridothelium virens TaxID=1048519 RepID=A0A6A6HG22_VIRVR|nr:hypothetical protein EV356DRAFT_574700 [Viridothelium virens]
MPLLDADHRGPLINLATWITLVAAILLAITKLGTKYYLAKRLQRDDVFMALALVVAIGETIATGIQVTSGLGQPQSQLSSQKFENFQKATLAAELFYIPTIYLAKLAPLHFVTTLCQLRFRRLIVQSTIVFIGVWIVISIFSIAFQCDLPQTWNTSTNKCFDRLAFWDINAVVDAFTQLLAAFLPIYLLHDLQLPWAKKSLAMLSFVPIALTVPLTILRPIYFSNTVHSTDLSSSAYRVALVSKIHANLSIVVCSFPFLKPVLEAMSVGMINNVIIAPAEELGNQSKRSNRLSSYANPFAMLGGREFTSGSNSKNSKNSNSKSGDNSHTSSLGFFSKVSRGRTDEVELGDQLRMYGSRERINQTTTIEVTSDARTSEQSANEVIIQ